MRALLVTVEHRLGETVAVRTLQTLLLGALAASALVLAVMASTASCIQGR